MFRILLKDEIHSMYRLHVNLSSMHTNRQLDHTDRLKVAHPDTCVH